MNIADISIKRPIMMTMFVMVFVLFGALGYFSLTLDMMPDTDIPYVTVQTVYPGGSPQEIETQITKEIEDAISTISGIKEITSYSMEGISLVNIEFELGKDPDIANQETKDKVETILNELPDDAEKPVIEKLDLASEPIMDIVLEGDISRIELYELADKKMKDRLAQINGVAKVDIIGGQAREISVALDNRVIFENRISLQQLSQILAATNVELPGGHFKKNSQEYNSRMQGKFQSIEELKQFDVPTPYGTKQLQRIADVMDTGEEVRQRSIFFDNINNIKKNNIVLLSVVKSSEGNTVQIAEDINEEIPVINKELPEGVKLSIANDNSKMIKDSVNDTLMNVGLGILLTAFVLIFFLHDIRSTLIAAISMPISIISTFMLMQAAGFSLNIMSLMGLSTAVGVLVVNSVIVLENIFRFKMMGKSKKESASEGTKEVTVAVIASTLTNIVVFLPIANMSSIVGEFFQEFALTVTFATIFSLLVSFTLTPMLASLILKENNDKKHPIGNKLEKMFTAWENWYERILQIILKNKLRTALVIALTVVLFVGSFFIASQLNFEFVPTMDQGDIKVEVELPQGYKIEETVQLISEVETELKKHEEVKHILTQVGKISDMDVGTNLAKMSIKLVNSDERDITSSEAVDLLIKDLSAIPNAQIRVTAISMSNDRGGSAIQFSIRGTNNEKLEEYKTQVINKIKDIDGLVNLNTSSRSGKPEITLFPKRIEIADAGLTVYDLAITLRAAMEGLVTTTYKEEGEEYDIRVQMKDDAIDSPNKIANLAVVSSKGTYRMSQLADIKFTEGYSKIIHKDKLKAINISGDAGSGYALGAIVNEIQARLAEMEMESGYSITWSGDAKLMAEAIADIGQALFIAIALTYMLLAALLESFTQPLIILGTVPLAMIGVFGGLYFTGTSIGITAMMAVIMLVGIVVNNAILIIDYVNILIKEGKGVKEALVKAAPTKLKPILMSTIAIMLGMLPMAIGVGDAGAEMRQPMGVVSIGGILVSMFLTLIFVPALFQITHKTKKA